MKRIAVYPGTFDPLTNGHLDVIERVCRLGFALIVAVGENRSKAPLFPIKQRIEIIRRTLVGIEGVEIDQFDGLLVDYARGKGADLIICGLRNAIDFNIQMEMAVLNRRLAPEVETLFIPAREENIFISSSRVKEIAGFGGDTEGMAPSVVREFLY